MTAGAAVRTTAEDLTSMPEDGRRRELVNGKIIEMAPAGFEHGDVAAGIGAELRTHVHGNGLGRVLAAETGFLLSRSPDTVRAADAAFVAADRLPPPDRRAGFLEMAPDLAVEVVSPSDRAGAVLAKATAWLDAGSRAVWVVYPAARTVAVHSPGGHVQLLAGTDVVSGGDVVPGFEITVAALFD